MLFCKKFICSKDQHRETVALSESRRVGGGGVVRRGKEPGCCEHHPDKWGYMPSYKECILVYNQVLAQAHWNQTCGVGKLFCHQFWWQWALADRSAANPWAGGCPALPCSLTMECQLASLHSPIKLKRSFPVQLTPAVRKRWNDA